MFGLTAPLWLAALAAVPLVRWLHRWRAPLRSAPVSAAFLWKTAEDVSAGGQRQTRPDPAWRRRALIIALLAISLAGPWWQQEVSRVTVWIDDSLSMSTVENGETRLQTGLAGLAEALAGVSSVEADLRSLTDPAGSRPGSDPQAFDADSWLLDGSAALSPPPAVTLDRGTAHWLVTDGADADLRQWAERAPLARVFNVGEATENVAVTQLAVRRSLQDANAFDVLAAVSNAGARAANRSLLIGVGSGESRAFDLTLAAGETRYVTMRQAAVRAALSAGLEPGDVTSGDDSLVLQGPAFARTPAAIDATCPEPLQRSLRVHSGLRAVALGETAELQVLCSPGRAAAPGPTLSFYGAAPVPAAEAPRWQPGNGRLEELYLPPGWIAASAWDAEPGDGVPLLLAADGRPLIVVHAGPPVAITSTLDMSHGEFVRQPEYAVLVAALVDIALGRTLLDPLITSSRNPAASVIAPSRLQAAQTLGPKFGAVRQPLGEIFLALAAFVLLADLLIIWRASRAARHG